MFDVRGWVERHFAVGDWLHQGAGRGPLFGALEQINRRLDELGHQLLSFNDARNGAPLPTMVACLWSDNGAPRVLSETVWLAWGEAQQITIPSMLPIPRESWVVALGPAMLRSVQVGNQLQECSGGSFAGKLCVLHEPVLLGMQLCARIEQPTQGVTYRA